MLIFQAFLKNKIKNYFFILFFFISEFFKKQVLVKNNYKIKKKV